MARLNFRYYRICVVVRSESDRETVYSLPIVLCSEDMFVYLQKSLSRQHKVIEYSYKASACISVIYAIFAIIHT